RHPADGRPQSPDPPAAPRHLSLHTGRAERAAVRADCRGGGEGVSRVGNPERPGPGGSHPLSGADADAPERTPTPAAAERPLTDHRGAITEARCRTASAERCATSRDSGLSGAAGAIRGRSGTGGSAGQSLTGFPRPVLTACAPPASGVRADGG